MLSLANAAQSSAAFSTCHQDRFLEEEKVGFLGDKKVTLGSSMFSRDFTAGGELCECIAGSIFLAGMSFAVGVGCYVLGSALIQAVPLVIAALPYLLAGVICLVILNILCNCCLGQR